MLFYDKKDHCKQKLDIHQIPLINIIMVYSFEYFRTTRCLYIFMECLCTFFTGILIYLRLNHGQIFTVHRILSTALIRGKRVF